MKIKIPRYVTGALLFGLIWASIQYVQGRITDPVKLLVLVLVFLVLGSALSWGLTFLIQWFKNRN